MTGLSIFAAAAAFGAESGFAGFAVPAPPVWTLSPDYGVGHPLQVTVTLSGFGAAKVGEGYALTIPDQVRTGTPGAPDIAFVAKTIPGVSGGRATVRVKEVTSQDFTNVVVIPSETITYISADGEKPPVEKRERTQSQAIYGSGGFWPVDVAAVQEAWMGTQKLLRIECHPLKYDPSLQKIHFCSMLSVEVVFEPENRNLGAE